MYTCKCTYDLFYVCGLDSSLKARYIPPRKLLSTKIQCENEQISL